jgi:aryl-alcohol dehydrogenase-like predicted oxidoreductase
MIPRLRFGRTGHESSRAVFGAAALARATQAEADRARDLLLAYGVNHIDAAASYGDAELRVGAWMPRHRGDFFLATKTGQRTYAAAREEIRTSLARLRVDRIDLLQLHNLVKPDEWEVAFGADGALRAAVEAREEGRVRFIGVTGHGTRVARMHLRSLERFDFDSVLLPYSFAAMGDPEYAADFEALAAVCADRDVAVQTIKGIARRRWSEGQQPTRATWYEPLERAEDIERAVRWVLGRPHVFLNTAGDLALLPTVLAAADRPSARPSAETMREADRRLGVEPLFVRGHTAGASV